VATKSLPAHLLHPLKSKASIFILILMWHLDAATKKIPSEECLKLDRTSIHIRLGSAYAMWPNKTFHALYGRTKIKAVSRPASKALLKRQVRDVERMYLRRANMLGILEW
jgi:hypothetical protein